MPIPLLLAIIEIGGYPNFTPLYQRLGYQVIIETGMRKVLKRLKKCQPTIIIAEFNFQSDFRDRTSSLESLMAVVQRFDSCKTVIFYEERHVHQLRRLQAHFDFAATLSFPISEQVLEQKLLAISSHH